MLAKALVLVLLFAALASRTGYKLTARVFGSWVATAGGCATGSGVWLHAVVFAVLAGAAMRALWRRRRYNEGYSFLDWQKGYKEVTAARKSLRDRKKARTARYNEAKARGDHIGMRRYRADVGKQMKESEGKYNTYVGNSRMATQAKCPKGWTASDADMCCEQWWPDSRAQRCKTLSTGAVWDRTWRAKKFNE